MFSSPLSRNLAAVAALSLASSASAQQVCLPSPRLLTIVPMGGQVGTEVDVTITGDDIDHTTELLFSTPKITAKPKADAQGKPLANSFVVSIAADAPAGVHDARVRSRLGVSSSRAFAVGTMPEVSRSKPNTTLETAFELKTNTVCNAAMTKRSVDFYSFTGVKGKRIIVDCAASGIDSKLDPVVIVADEQGRDLVANRINGMVDFTPPADGKYIVKVHSLTFRGGPEHFYRLALIEAPADGPAPRQPGTRAVNSFSWLADAGSAGSKPVAEVEPNNQRDQAHKITLPAEITGSFYPAADVDTYEFTAKKGETWWVEVASERLGLPTNPFVVVQRVVADANGAPKVTDVAEIDDIPAPMKPSSNGYSYDGPPYDAGSADPLGKVEIKEDGTYQLQIRDLFGGTRTDASHVYKLTVRKAAPDFAITGWALHMTLRNGDRNALSKPIALRGGATSAFEVVTIRKDGFDGDIELALEGLPEGISATGLKIPAGKTKGLILITAAENAPASFGTAKLVGRAKIDGKDVTRTGTFASMIWPVRDAKQEIPRPRLLADIPVSVGGSEYAPVSISPAENKTFEAKAGEKLTIPLKAVWRSDFTGSAIKLKAMGNGFDTMKDFEFPMKAEKFDAVLDLAVLKTPPGDYTLAFYGPATAKYRPNPAPVKLTDAIKSDAVNASGTPAGPTPKETVDIVVSEPVRVVVKPADKK